MSITGGPLDAGTGVAGPWASSRWDHVGLEVRSIDVVQPREYLSACAEGISEPSGDLENCWGPV